MTEVYENDHEKPDFAKLTTASRQEMEQLSLKVRDSILTQPPIQFLGYLWAQLHMSVLGEIREQDEDYRPNKELLQTFQFALEYVHAVWSCYPSPIEKESQFDEAQAAAFFEILDELKAAALTYCLTSSAANIEDGDGNPSDVEFHAKSSWTLLRGNRYQVLEGEFFNFVLEPHADALREIYGMEFHEIAAEIQAIADSIRTGFSDAVEKMQEGMDKTYALMNSADDDLSTAIEAMTKTDSSFSSAMSSAMHDIFNAGICNISRHTKLSTPLLEDLSYEPGGNDEFFADGEYCGTPMRTLPARIKPGIKLGEDYYVTDGQFVRDAAYRAIQRGLLARLPAYRESWNHRQKVLIEQSFPRVFDDQLSAATIYSEVYFRDRTTNQWVETDLIMAIDDALLVIEAKAGVMAMHSPATNFARHERAIRELITKAYKQCERFTNYLSSAPEVPLYNLVDGEYVEVGRVRQKDYRVLLPIGLTVEAFTPFSAISKQQADIEPLLGQHPFISMSVDDLFVLRRFLPSTGEMLHYLEVRQQAAGIPEAFLFDEIEHLGAYIQDNRFDMRIRDQLEETSSVTWNSFGDVVDKHFEGRTWESEQPPHQKYPEELSKVLSALDRYRPAGWLNVDSHIRNFDDVSRKNLAGYLVDLKKTLPENLTRRFLFGEENPIQIWLCLGNIEPANDALRYQGEVGCLVANTPTIISVQLSYDDEGEIANVKCRVFSRPPAIQANYPALKTEAERQLAKAKKTLGRKKSRKKRR